MTPREADIAFILEGVAHVRGVYVLPSSPADPPGADARDVVVAVDWDSRSIAMLHYMLLRAFSREELGTVSVFAEVPPVLLRRVVRLELSDAERRAARERVEERRRVLRPEEPAMGLQDPWSSQLLYLRQPTTALPLRALFVSDDQELQRSLIGGLPSGWRTPSGASVAPIDLTDSGRSIRSMLARALFLGAARRWIMKPIATNGLSGFSASLVRIAHSA